MGTGALGLPGVPQAADSLFYWPQWAMTRPDAIALRFEQSHQPFGVADPFGRAARRDPTPPLGQLTWRQLARQVERIARTLQSEGFLPGDRMVHACGNSHSGVLVALASMAIGTIEVPIDPLIAPPSAQALADLVGGRWLTLSAALTECLDRDVADPAAGAADADADADADAAAALLTRHAQLDGGDASLILFTSGSGGQSRAVTLSRRNLATNAAAKLQAVPQSCQDVRVCLLPICHAYARTCDLATWLLSGCTLAITSGWDGWKRVAPLVRPTLVNTVPSVALRLLDEPPDSPELSRLRLVGCGGAALPIEAFAQFDARGMTIIQGYGLTEASPVICSASPANARPGSVGCPVNGWRTRLDDDGRLWVRGDGVMIGYWNDPQETQRRIVDGWLDTGDLIQIDPADGQFRVLGRVDDRITLPNARKIHPALIEQRVSGLPGVLHALLLPAGRHVELWIDVHPELRAGGDWTQRVHALLADLPVWQRPRRVIVLPRPLAEIPAALTRKGTPVRTTVMAYFNTA